MGGESRIWKYLEVNDHVSGFMMKISKRNEENDGMSRSG
jgi:hypothetical protein